MQATNYAFIKVYKKRGRLLKDQLCGDPDADIDFMDASFWFQKAAEYTNTDYIMVNDKRAEQTFNILEVISNRLGEITEHLHDIHCPQEERMANKGDDVYEAKLAKLEAAISMGQDKVNDMGDDKVVDLKGKLGINLADSEDTQEQRHDDPDYDAEEEFEFCCGQIKPMLKAKDLLFEKHMLCLAKACRHWQTPKIWTKVAIKIADLQGNDKWKCASFNCICRACLIMGALEIEATKMHPDHFNVEFQQMKCQTVNGQPLEDFVNKLFAQIDSNGDGQLSFEELTKVLRSKCKDIDQYTKLCKAASKVADADRDGLIDRDEFVQAIMKPKFQEFLQHVTGGKLKITEHTHYH